MDKGLTKKNDLIKHFSRLFKTRDELPKDDLISEKDYIGYMDHTSVVMVIPKKKSFKARMQANFDVTEHKLMDLNYSIDKYQGHTCRYSCGYLSIILQLCKNYESVDISLKEDYPLKVETEDFIVILAPRSD